MNSAEDGSEYAASVKEAESAVLRGLVSDGPVETAAASALCDVQYLSPWILTDQAGQKALNFHAAEQNQIGRSILEQSLREACAALIAAAEGHGVKAMLYKHSEAPEASIPRLLDLAVFLGSQRQIDAAVVFTLMEDVISMTTIEEAEGVFLYLESRIQKLRQVYNFAGATAHSKLSVLKICNQLLLRLSRASSAELCGRILMFLTRLLPLLDRSGLNVLGQFNTSHSTPVEDVAEGEVDSNGEPIDAAFYSSFWGLQAIFEQPYSAIEPSKWTATITDIKRVLTEFGKQPVALASSSGENAGSSMQEDVQLTVKYLSSRKLIRLQLQDAALRRHFLLQALIFLHACQHPVVKKDQQKRDALRSKQVLEAEELEKLLFAELERTPKHGAEFAAAVKLILQRETRWAKWKSENCEDFTKDRREPVKLSPLPTHPRLSSLAAPKSKSIDVGSDALNRLWNISRDNLSCLKGQNRRKTPNLADFLEPVITEMDPEEAVEEMYKTKREFLFQWKALRMIARTSLPTFSKMLTPPPSKARKGKEADRKEAANETRAKLDLEDAVHDLLPDHVPEGAKRRPLIAAAASTPASVAVSEAEPSSRTEAADAAAAVLAGGAEADAPGAAEAAVQAAQEAAAGGPMDVDSLPSAQREEQQMDVDILPAGMPEAPAAEAAGVPQDTERGSRGQHDEDSVAGKRAEAAENSSASASETAAFGAPDEQIAVNGVQHAPIDDVPAPADDANGAAASAAPLPGKEGSAANGQAGTAASEQIDLDGEEGETQASAQATAGAVSTGEATEEQPQKTERKAKAEPLRQTRASKRTKTAPADQ